MKTKLASLIGLLFALIFSSTACSKTFTAGKADLVYVFKQISENALTSDKPSAATEQTLRLLFLDKQFKKDPVYVITELDKQSSSSRDTALTTALCELSFLYAKRIEKKEWEQAAAYYAFSASKSTDFLLRNYQPSIGWGIDPSRSFLTGIYNASVSRLVELWGSHKHAWTEALELKTSESTLTIKVDAAGKELFAPEYFDSLDSSYNIKISGLRNHYREYGIGAPLVGIKSNVPDKPNYEPFQITPRVVVAVTAVLRFDPPDLHNPLHQQAQLRFYDPLRADSITTPFGNVPLASDFSTPFGMLLAQLRPLSNPFLRALSSDKYLDTIHLFMLDRYDPHKIPVVMVHGLFSEPATFVQMFNDLRGVKEIRDNYQFWFFAYPTGLPFLYTGAQLRKNLEEVRNQFDPQGTNCKFNNMVVVGHSMGGLLSKMLVQDPGNNLWNAIWSSTPEELRYSETDAEKELLQQMFLYKPVPYVRRAVFIATPHRGSDISTNFIGRLGSWLIDLPQFLTQTTANVLTLNQSKLKVDAKNYISKAPTSIDQLSPNAVVLKTTAELPISPEVAYHLIIGIRGAHEGPGSSDGVVRYESAHISGAESEKLVPANHSCLEHPLTIAEVKRILLEHQQKLGTCQPSLSGHGQ